MLIYNSILKPKNFYATHYMFLLIKCYPQVCFSQCTIFLLSPDPYILLFFYYTIMLRVYSGCFTHTYVFMYIHICYI